MDSITCTGCGNIVFTDEIVICPQCQAMDCNNCANDSCDCEGGE